MKSLDDVFELFTLERRRLSLYYLEEQDGPVSVEELAAKIEEWETGELPPEVSDEKHQVVMLTLMHQHLPKAAGTEYVEYDPDRNIVELSGSTSEFKVILSVAEAIEQPREDDIIHLS